jgi:hypothetical protein
VAESKEDKKRWNRALEASDGAEPLP